MIRWLGWMMLIGASGVPAWAKGEAPESGAPVSVAGGIVAPEPTLSTYQNPAGLAGLRKWGASVTAGYPQSALKDGMYGASLSYGKESFGMSAGVDHSANPSETAAVYGLAVSAPSMNMRLGVAGQTPISPSGDSTFNLGAQFQLGREVTLGLTAIDVTNNPDEYGLGLRMAVSSDVDLVGDVTVDDKLGRAVGAPAIRLGTSQAALTVGYGVKISAKDAFHSQQIREGFGLGGALRIGSDMLLQAYYNQLSKYFLSFTAEL